MSRSQQFNMVLLTSYNLSAGTELTDLTHSIKYASHHGLPIQLYGTVAQSKDVSVSLCMLVLSEDHSLVLIRRSTGLSSVVWTREEALASILSVEMVDLPVSKIMAEMEDEFGTTDNILQMFVTRFITQFSQLWTFMLQLKHRLRTSRQHVTYAVDDGDKDDVLGDESDGVDEEYLTRDDFNLHKMIVVVTAPGKIFGLDSLTGSSIWENFMPNLEPFQKLDQQMLPLYVQRTTAHFPHQPLCTVLGKDKVRGLPLLYSFHPITGVTADGTPSTGEIMNYNVITAIKLLHTDEHFLHPLLLLDTQFQYHVYPESAKELVRNVASSLFTFVTDINTGLLTGYSVGTTSKQMLAQPLWTVYTDRNTETIVNVVAKRGIEHVHSQGIVLEDRSVLYKYLNPNLVAVVTEGEDNQQKEFFNVYLVDGVSGNLVFHCTHRKSKGPIHLVHSENWVIYNYWNVKLRRMELAVLELYEGSHQSNATAFSSLHPPPPPIVMRQAYIFPGHISAMATTITEKGITSKELIFALESGGVRALPKLLIDPRRPEVLSQEAREEGLVPYMPELPPCPHCMINYNQTVFNIRGIHTAPAGLESTSLVLAYGLDLFYTRVMPSKMFDVLKEDFDYLFISSVLVGMIAVSVITQKLAAKKALKRAWK